MLVCSSEMNSVNHKFPFKKEEYRLEVFMNCREGTAKAHNLGFPQSQPAYLGKGPLRSRTNTSLGSPSRHK